MKIEDRKVTATGKCDLLETMGQDQMDIYCFTLLC